MESKPRRRKEKKYGISGEKFYRGLLYGKKGETETVILGGIESIGQRAFYKNENLINVTLPDSIMSIEESAFEGCKALKCVTVSDDVKRIDTEDPHELHSIDVPVGAKYIGRRAFAECSHLESITIPDGIEVIEEAAFSNCYHLTSVIIPNTVKRIERYAFYCCYSLQKIVIPNGVISIAEDAFYYCYELELLTMPNSVISIEKVFHDLLWCKECLDDFIIIGDGILYEYKGEMDDVVIPDGVKRITRFSLWQIRECIDIPESVTSIDSDALGDTRIILHENGYHISLDMDGFWDNWNYVLSEKYLNEMGITEEEYRDKHSVTEERYLNDFWFTKDFIKRKDIFKKMTNQCYKLPMAILMAVSHEEDEFFHAYVKSNIKEAVKHLIMCHDLENFENILKMGYVGKSDIDELMDYALMDVVDFECYRLLFNYRKMYLNVKR